MTRCKLSKPKHRVSVSNNKQPNNYKHGMKGHKWEKLFDDNGVHIGRKCQCGKTVLNPKGK